MSDYVTPFRPGGGTVALNGSFSVTPSGTLIGIGGDFSLLAYNRSSTQDAYLAYGQSSAAIASAIVPLIGVGIPAGGNAPLVLSCPKGSIQSFTFSGPTFFGVVVPAGNAQIDLTPGDGA